MRGYLWFLLFFNALLSGGSPAKAEWREATTDHFVIVSGGSEAELIRLGQRLEAVHWLMTQATGITPDERTVRVRIFLLDNIGDFHRVLGLRSSSDIAGIYLPGIEGAVALVPRNQSGGFSTNILFHEYAHHFMLQYLTTVYPPWYVEGFAELMSTASFERPDEITYGKVPLFRTNELLDDSWTPISRMFAPRTAADPSAGVADYSQYWLAAHYLTFAPERNGQMRNFLIALNTGRPLDEAYAAFPGGIQQLDRDMHRYLRQGRFRYLHLALPPDVLRTPSLRLLRRAEVAMLDAEMRAARTLSHDQTVALAAEVGALVARYPDDPAASRLHARLLLDAGNFAQAQVAADRVLAIDPGNVRALTYRGLAMLRGRHADGSPMDAAFVREARSYIVRANRANPDDQIPLIANYQSYQLADIPAPEIALEGLNKAMHLVPQESSLRMLLAQDLINRRRLPIARTILAPLAFDPHASGQQSFALQLLQWIDAGGEGDPPIYVEPPVTETDSN